MSEAAFLDRVFRVLQPPARRFEFESWRHGGRPTSEGVGVLPMDVDVDAFVARVMDVDHYVGNVAHVVECRSIDDPAYERPRSVRFYQRVQIPVLGAIHMELVRTDHGLRDGWRVLAWHQHAGTDALDPGIAARSGYNVGAWLVRPDGVGYALSSAPRREDVGRLRFAALTRGADAAAPRVIRDNIEGMARWAAR